MDFEVTKIIYYLAVILFATKAMGMATRKLGLPQVVGMVIAGLLIGPAIFSQIPIGFNGLINPTEIEMDVLKTFSQIGVILILFSSGLETDLKDLKTVNSLPGEFPYLRGKKKSENNWLIRQDYLVGKDFKAANALALDGMMKGVTAPGFDLSQTEKVLKADMKALLNGIELKAVEVNFKGCKDLSVLKNFIAVAKEKGAKASAIRASFDYDPLKELNTNGVWSKAIRELLVNCAKQHQGCHLGVCQRRAYLFLHRIHNGKERRYARGVHHALFAARRTG